MPNAEIEFEGCHTIGMLLQSYGEASPDITFISYRVVHPLERKVSLKVATREPVSVQEAIKSVQRKIQEDIENIRLGLR